MIISAMLPSGCKTFLRLPCLTSHDALIHVNSNLISELYFQRNIKEEITWFAAVWFCEPYFVSVARTTPGAARTIVVYHGRYSQSRAASNLVGHGIYTENFLCSNVTSHIISYNL